MWNRSYDKCTYERNVWLKALTRIDGIVLVHACDLYS